jgi:hypothetical protein
MFLSMYLRVMSIEAQNVRLQVWRSLFAVWLVDTPHANHISQLCAQKRTTTRSL